MRACARFGINPWDEFPNLPLAQKADILNFDEIATFDEIELKTQLAKLTLSTGI